MKKILVIALCVIGFMFIAAPIYMNETHPVFLNGKPFAKAALINGIIAIKVEDLARATGDTLTLEHFKLNGNTLVTVTPGTQTWKVKEASPALTDAGSPAQKVREGALVPAVQKANTQAKIKSNSNAAIIAVRKAGGVSNEVFMFQGKAWVPLKDVARALGGVFNQPAARNMKPTDSFSLNFTKNAPNALIGLL